MKFAIRSSLIYLLIILQESCSFITQISTWSLKKSSIIYSTIDNNNPKETEIKSLSNESKLGSKADFPIFDNTNSNQENYWYYLDSAATSQKPTAVTEALTHYYENQNSNVHRGAHSISRLATSRYEEARDSVKHFINANSRNEIIFTSGATEAINLIAYCMKFEEGDEVICGELDHHSNIVPFHIMQDRYNINLKTIPLAEDNSGYDIRALEDLLSKQTKVVAIQQVSNVLGCIHPLESIIVPLIRKKAPQAKILIDACQSVPHMKVDVQALDADFMAVSGHKMCGPTGIGFLYGKEHELNNLQPFLGGGEMILNVDNTHSTYAKAPSRFEAGTPNIAGAIGLGAAIQYLQDIGMDRIHEYEMELGDYLYQKLSQVPGVTILGPKEDRVALAAFVCEDAHSADVCTFLDMEGIAIRGGHHCCQPLHKALGYSHSSRVSLYFYNTKDEIDYFIVKLQETLEFLRSMK